MKSAEAEPPKPPEPPPFERRVQISGVQLVGIGLLSLLPLAALTGLLGTKEEEARASAGALELSVRYPARTHHSVSEAVELAVKNTGTQPLAGAGLRLGDGYLSHFEDARFTPAVQRLGEDGAELELGELAPGETRRLVVELRARHFGTHDGRISAVAEGAEPVVLEVSTLVLP